jgi:hypothetical protein
MRQEMVLPKRCFKCGNVFDLSYDFKEGEEPGFLTKKEGKQVPKEFLCYYCRDKDKATTPFSKESEGNSNWLNEDILKDEEH